MAFFFTEEQVVQAAVKAFREHAEADRQALAQWQAKGPVTLADWTDPDTELDQIGEAFKDVLALVRPEHPVVSLASIGA